MKISFKIVFLTIILCLLTFIYGDVENYGDYSKLIFDGGDKNNSKLSMNGNSEFTTAFWIKPTGSQTTNYDIILNKETTYEIALTKDNKLKYAISIDKDGDGKSDSWAWITTNVQLDTNEYQHIALTYDNGEVKIYKNGELVYDEKNPKFDYIWHGNTRLPDGSLVTCSNQYNNSPLYIANRPWRGYWGSNIIVSGVGIFNRSLTEDEIKKLYNGEMTLDELKKSGCIFFAPLINDTKDIINGINGKLQGSTIQLHTGEAPKNLKKMMESLYKNNNTKAPIPKAVFLISLFLISTIPLWFRK
ncbi:protein of unknown function [Methanocaldococcus lauensis]|nr:protein of unknown function [Methanocaldococcus lauensis]